MNKDIVNCYKVDKRLLQFCREIVWTLEKEQRPVCLNDVFATLADADIKKIMKLSYLGMPWTEMFLQNSIYPPVINYKIARQIVRSLFGKLFTDAIENGDYHNPAFLLHKLESNETFAILQDMLLKRKTELITLADLSTFMMKKTII
jgi:hypothetical protein